MFPSVGMEYGGLVHQLEGGESYSTCNTSAV